MKCRVSITVTWPHSWKWPRLLKSEKWLKVLRNKRDSVIAYCDETKSWFRCTSFYTVDLSSDRYLFRPLTRRLLVVITRDETVHLALEILCVVDGKSRVLLLSGNISWIVVNRRCVCAIKVDPDLCDMSSASSGRQERDREGTGITVKAANARPWWLSHHRHHRRARCHIANSFVLLLCLLWLRR